MQISTVNPNRLSHSGLKHALFRAAFLPAVFLAGCQPPVPGPSSVQKATFVTSTGVPFVPKKGYPAFSWDTVPLFSMFADNDRLLLSSEVRKIAAESGFIGIEKQHGSKLFGDAVLGLQHESGMFKAENPDITVLAYFNGAITYPFSRYTRMFTPERIDQHPDLKAFLLTDPETGELRPGFCLKVLNPDARAWWSDCAADMVREGDADGIFIDQLHGFAWMHPKETRPAVADAVVDMMRQLKEKIGPDKIFLANNGTHSERILALADAVMFEHYKESVTHTREKLLEDWQWMERIAEEGKISVYRFGAKPEPGTPLAEFTSPRDRYPKKAKEYAALAREQLPYFLSVYLIGAQPYSYFQWNWDWRLMTGPLEHYPEFHKPLGKPLGRYTRVHPDQWEFTREFEHASVWVDTDKKESRITWK